MKAAMQVKTDTKTEQTQTREKYERYCSISSNNYAYF